MKDRIRKFLEVASESRVEELEDRVAKLEEGLRDEIISDQPQLSFVLELLQNGSEPRPVLVEALQDEFDISQATAYRRLETLEEEMGFIRENDEGEMDLIIDVSQDLRKESVDREFFSQ